MRPSRTSLFACLVLVAPVTLVGGPPAAGQTSDPVNVLTIDLGTLGGAGERTYAYDINGDGVVVGDSTAVAEAAFRYDLVAGGPMVDLGVLPDQTMAQVLGITDGGVIMGMSGWSSGFRYDTTAATPQMTPVPWPPGAGDNPWLDLDRIGTPAMNSAGWIIGMWGDDTDVGTDYRAFVYDPLQHITTDLGVYGYFEAYDANADSAVGYREDDETGFVQSLDGGARIDLNTEFGWDESSANAISDDGWVVGEYCDDSLVSDEYCANEEWTGFAWDQTNQDQTNQPVKLAPRVGASVTPVLVNDGWIIAREGQESSYGTVAYSRQNLTLSPIVLEGLRYPEAISDAGVVLGEVSGLLDAIYDLQASPPQMIELPTLGGTQSQARGVAEVGDHTVVVGYATTSAEALHATAWVLGVPDAPTIALADDTDGIVPVGSVTADQTPTLTGTAEPSGPVVIRRDGTVLDTVTADPTTGAWSYTSPSLSDGTYGFTATYEPSSGWPSNPSTANVTVETVEAVPAPTVTIGSAKVRGATVTVAFTVDGTYVPASLTCQLDDTTSVPCAGPTEHTFTDVAKGDHVVTVRAETQAGLAGNDSTVVTVKSGKVTEPQPPSGALSVSVTSVTAVKDGPITAEFLAAAGAAPYSYTCSLVGATTDVTETCTSPWAYPHDASSLAGGKYQLTVTVTDSAVPPASVATTVTVNVPGPRT